MKNQKGYTLNEIVYVIILLFGFIGWILNLVKVINYPSENMIVTVLQVVGVVFPPFGAIMGYIV